MQKAGRLYQATPLFVRILVGMAAGVALGLMLGHRTKALEPVSEIVLQLLRLLATPLIFVAVAHSLYQTSAGGRQAGRLLWFAVTNSLAAIFLGLVVGNAMHPGFGAGFLSASHALNAKPSQIGKELLDKIPSDWVTPFAKNEIISVVLLAIAFGLALRSVRKKQDDEGKTGYKSFERFLETSFELVMAMLRWVFELIPLAVLAVVAKSVGEAGFAPLASMGLFVIAVVLALALQACFYLVRLGFAKSRQDTAVGTGGAARASPPGSLAALRMRAPRGSFPFAPLRIRMTWAWFLGGSFDALTMAFSTASSAATLPVSYACATEKMGIGEDSASLGLMVGGAFNHDGTAVYECMAALFVAQAIGLKLGIEGQATVLVMAFVASVSVAGIPEAGLVTMIAVFNAVHLPIEYIPLLLPFDWLLDRFRTAINVMGQLSLAGLLDDRE